MKRKIALLLTGAALFVAVACGKNVSSTQIANPFVDYASMEEAEKVVGFTLAAPEALDGFSHKTIQVMRDSMLQVIFSEENDRLVIRKEAGDGDISGDYNNYARVETVSVGERLITMKGGDSGIQVAIWTDGEYTYAVTANVPLTQDVMVAIIAEIA